MGSRVTNVTIYSLNTPLDQWPSLKNSLGLSTIQVSCSEEPTSFDLHPDLHPVLHSWRRSNPPRNRRETTTQPPTSLSSPLRIPSYPPKQTTSGVTPVERIASQVLSSWTAPKSVKNCVCQDPAKTTLFVGITQTSSSLAAEKPQPKSALLRLKSPLLSYLHSAPCISKSEYFKSESSNISILNIPTSISSTPW